MELNKALRHMGLYNKYCDISSMGIGLRRGLHNSGNRLGNNLRLRNPRVILGWEGGSLIFRNGDAFRRRCNVIKLRSDD